MNTVRKSELQELIRNIVKTIIKEGLDNNRSKPGIYPLNFKSVPNYIRIKKSNVPGEFVVAWFFNGKFNNNKSYYTDDLGDATNTFKIMKQQVDVANGTMKEDSVAAAVSPVTGPNAFKSKRTMEEQSVTANVSGYNIPGAFSKRGGSSKGVEGSEKLGYTLTNAGKKEMQRTADKLLEDK